MALKPNSTNLTLYRKYPNLNRNTLKNCRNSFYREGKESGHLLLQLEWIYGLMSNKIIKGIPPDAKDKVRLKAIEKIIGLRE